MTIKKIKTEQDWLKLPKNVPKENISIDDPNVRPRLIHKNRTICHSKTYWASIKRKPPLKEFELPDLFSDNEELETGKLMNNTSPKTLNSSDTHTDKGMPHEDNKGVVVDTVKPTTETPVTSESAANDTPSKEPTSTDILPINTEKTGEVIRIEPACTPIEQDSDNTTNIDSVSAENSAVNTENKTANSEKQTIDNEINRQDETGAPVTTDNDIDTEVPTSNRVNTLNMTETDHEDSMATNKTPNGNDLPIQGQGEININTEKSPPNHEQPTTSTQQAKTHNQKTIKEDWSSLMFSSEDSLFDEMTKQLEDNTPRPKIDKKSLGNHQQVQQQQQVPQCRTKKPYLILYIQATEQMQ